MNNKKKLIAILGIMFGGYVFATNLINPPNVPLETGGATKSKSNLMFVLDDSKNMGLDYMPDQVGNSDFNAFHCKTAIRSGNTTTVTQFNRLCISNNQGQNLNIGSQAPNQIFSANSTLAADALLMAYDFNKLYYNPAVRYVPAVDHLGNSLGNQSFTAAREDPFRTTATRNLATTFRETYYCTKQNPTTAELSNTAVCRRNGINTGNPFNYYTDAFPNTTFIFPVSGVSTPHYYNILARDFCDSSGVNCSTNQSAGIPTPIRWCLVASDTTANSVSGTFNSGINRGKNRCQAAYEEGTYRFPRIGNLQRVEISEAERTNFANWYSYYRTRINAMKTITSLAFSNIDSDRKVGFMTVNGTGSVSSSGESKFLPIRDFDVTQKQNFYTILFAQTVGGESNLREALAKAGRYYAGKTDGINAGMINASNRRPDPVDLSCQKNYTFMATATNWNGNPGVDINGNVLTDQDNVDSGFSTRTDVAFDGNLGGNAAATLADVAMYYYKTDLRPRGSLNSNSVDVSENNVSIDHTNRNNAQHMITYMFSMGLDGVMNYTSNYIIGLNTDYENIRSGASGVCSWTTGTCNWPIPTPNSVKTADDLWHAATNGRGRYIEASSNVDMFVGLRNALVNSISVTSSSAAAATSSPNITAGDNFLYYTTYRTGKWDGEIAAKEIDPITGVLSEDDAWSARAILNSMGGLLTDTRTIYFNRNDSTGVGGRLFNFTYASLNATERQFFDNKCANNELTQCSELSLTARNNANLGSNLVNYLRGQRGFESDLNGLNPLYRTREFLLGDIVDSEPVYVGASRQRWTDAGYANFVQFTQTRQRMLYVGSNSGMIHAFNATTGEEEWALIPSQIMGNLWRLADTAYANNHQFYVNGPITVMDAFINNAWRTVLIASFGKGSKGYIALDVTNPTTPSVLWEYCATCVRNNNNIGFTYGNPIITKRGFDNTWVAYLPTGYDSITGAGAVLEVNLATGALLRTLITNTGTPTSPTGIAKINTYYENFQENNRAKYMYAGDLNGNIWKWDLTDPLRTVARRLGQAKDAAGNPQPITSKIEIGTINTTPVLFFGTGRYLNFDDYITTGIQSVYGIKDNNLDNGILRNNGNIIKQNLNTDGLLTQSSNKSVDWNNNIGWFFDLTSQVGERVNIAPILALGTLNVISNVPGNETCSVGGNSWFYQIDFRTGGSIPSGNDTFLARKLTGGLVVGQVVARLGGSGALKNFITDATGGVVPTGVNINITKDFKVNAGWREIIKQRR